MTTSAPFYRCQLWTSLFRVWIQSDDVPLFTTLILDESAASLSIALMCDESLSKRLCNKINRPSPRVHDFTCWSAFTSAPSHYGWKCALHGTWCHLNDGRSCVQRTCKRKTCAMSTQWRCFTCLVLWQDSNLQCVLYLTIDFSGGRPMAFRQKSIVTLGRVGRSTRNFQRWLSTCLLLSRQG